jgi:hypothetical protein
MNFGMNMNFGNMGFPNVGFNVSHKMSDQSLRIGDKIHLKSLATNKYLCAESQHNVVANRDANGPWETFTIEGVNKSYGSEVRYNDKIALRSCHGKLLCAEGNGMLIANRDNIGPWESFTIVDPANLGSNNIIPQWGALAALRSDHGKYVTFEYNGVASANKFQPGPTEQFHVTVAGLPGDYSQYQQPPQVSMNIQPQGFGSMSFNIPQHQYTQQPYSPPQVQYGSTTPTVIQTTTTYVQSSGTCQKCQGKGYFDAFGKPCEVNDFHKRHECPVCKGQRVTSRQTPCRECGGQGGVGPFGYCELTSVHKRSLCNSCNGQCYI